eukprot:2241053-Amphidinium_carterae.1
MQVDPYLAELLTQRMYAHQCFHNRIQRVKEGRTTTTILLYRLLCELQRPPLGEFQRANAWLLAEQLTQILVDPCVTGLNVTAVLQTQPEQELSTREDVCEYVLKCRHQLQGRIIAPDHQHQRGCECLQRKYDLNAEVALEPLEAWTGQAFMQEVMP